MLQRLHTQGPGSKEHIGVRGLCVQGEGGERRDRRERRGWEERREGEEEGEDM